MGSVFYTTSNSKKVLESLVLISAPSPLSGRTGKVYNTHSLILNNSSAIKCSSRTPVILGLESAQNSGLKMTAYLKKKKVAKLTVRILQKEEPALGGDYL